MTHPSPPFRLSEGLALDSTHLILPWNAQPEALADIGEPQIQVTSGVAFLTWAEATVFDGIAANVTFRSDCAKVYWLDARSEEPFENAQDKYNFILPQLVSRFGSPHFTESDDLYPWTRWHYGDIRVSLKVAERFTDYVSFMVSNGL